MRIYSEQLLKEVAELLKEERARQKLSHEVLAKQAGIHRTAISHIENGRRRPSLYVFVKLAKALQTDPSELLKRAESRIAAAEKKTANH